MAKVKHNTLTGNELHVPGYVGASDPGAVGAGKYWIDTTDGVGSWRLKVRNATDTSWEEIRPDEIVINTLTGKSAPSASDVFLLEDSADSWERKKITWAQILANIPEATSDHKVMATSSDPTPGYLEDKIDTATLEIASNKIRVKASPSPEDSMAVKARKVKRLVEVCAGTTVCGAIMQDGTSRVWGLHTEHGFGTGGGNLWLPGTPALPVTATSPVKQMYFTLNNTYWLLEDGTVYSCGANASGQLGVGDTTARTVPTLIAGLTGVVKLAVPTDGLIAGVSVYALTSTGRIYGWGANASKQLGDGTTTARNAPYWMKHPTSKAFIDVSTAGGTYSYQHVIAADEDGDCFACGYNNVGQLGVGDTTDKGAWTAVNTVSGVTKVVASGNAATSCSFFLQDDNYLYACGDNAQGQLCNGGTTDSNTPVLGHVSLHGTIEDFWVSSANVTVAAKLLDGTCRTWGANNYGQCGNGNTTDPQTSPNAVAGITALKKAWPVGNATYLGFVFLQDDGTILAAGYTAGDGNLGVGHITNTAGVLQPVLGVAGVKIVDISSWGIGAVSGLVALDENGGMYMCGVNGVGQLGIGTILSRVSLSKVIF